MEPTGRSRKHSFSNRFFRKSAVSALFSLAMLATTQQAQAGAELKISDDAGINLGMGLRTSYTSAKNGAPNGTSRSNDFALDNIRLYMNGHYGDVIKATFNTERTGSGSGAAKDSVRVMDAIAQFEFMPEFNIWMGRLLPPSDRSNLDGPFYIMPWSYPGVVSNYPNLAVGRDNGVMVWGKPLGGKLVYSVGAFKGHNKTAGLSGASDRLLYAGRLAFNILDPEPAPAYYTGSWYGGAKDILTVAVSGNVQSDGVGTAAQKGDLKVWSSDVLFEKKFSFGVPTLEGAYYKYNLGARDCGSGEPGSPACSVTSVDNIGGQVDGKAYLFGAGFLFPQKVG